MVPNFLKMKNQLIGFWLTKTPDDQFCTPSLARVQWWLRSLLYSCYISGYYKYSCMRQKSVDNFGNDMLIMLIILILSHRSLSLSESTWILFSFHVFHQQSTNPNFPTEGRWLVIGWSIPTKQIVLFSTCDIIL